MEISRGQQVALVSHTFETPNHQTSYRESERVTPPLSCLLAFFADERWRDFIRTIIYDKYSGLMRITTRLDHIAHCAKSIWYVFVE